MVAFVESHLSDKRVKTKFNWLEQSVRAICQANLTYEISPIIYLVECYIVHW